MKSMMQVLSVSLCLSWSAAAQLVPASASASVLVPPPPASYYPGSAWGDVNGDGWDDLFVTNYYGPNHLYLNLPGPAGGPARVLVDATPAVLADPSGNGEGVVLADFDNDGDADIYVVNAGGTPNHLYRNLGAGTFADVSAGSGLAVSVTGEGCAVADVDLDGFLDIFLLTYGTTAGEPDHLYRNLGGLVFADVTASSGIPPDAAFGGACAFADYDGDGDPDLFVGNDGSANRFYENAGGTFTLVSPTTLAGAAAAAVLADPAGGCFGVRWLDPDADGDLDLYLSNASVFAGTSSLNRYFRNDAGPSGSRVLAYVPGSGAADTGEGMAVTSGDLDLDGDLDLAIANFGPSKVYLGAVGSPASIAVSGGLFAPAPAGWFAEPAPDTSSSATRCDYDRDGDLDIVVCGSAVRFYRNDAVTPGGSGTIATGAAKRTVSVRCIGDTAPPFLVPRDGQGTRVRPVIRTGGAVASTSYRGPLEQVDGGSGYAQDAAALVWSLGTAVAPRYLGALEITWADGAGERLFGLTPAASTLASMSHRRISVAYPAGISSYTGSPVTLSAPRLWRSSTSESFATVSIGNHAFALAAENLGAGSTAYLGIGLAPASVPVSGGELLIDPLVVLSIPVSDGFAKWPLPLAADPALIGLAFFAQCAAVHGVTGAVSWSNGLALVIQP